MRHLASRCAVIAALTVVALGGCILKDNRNCSRTDDCPIEIDAADAPIDTPSGCIANPAICTAPNLNCVDDDCSDCNDPGTQDTDCTEAAEPICGANYDCRACTADSECSSDFCNAGRCEDTADVIYLAPTGAPPGGNDANPCTSTAKCATLTRAMTVVNATRKFVKMDPGTYSVPGPTLIAVSVVVHGTGANLERSMDNEIVHVNAAAGPVTFSGVVLRNANGGGGADGIRCTDSTLTLDGVTVQGNDAQGVDANNCTVTVTRSSITGNDDGIRCVDSTLNVEQVTIETNVAQGIETSNCVVMVNRASLINNDGGGVQLTDGRFVITNSFIIDNGRSNALFGGLSLAPNMTPNVLEFNTITANTAQNTNPGGVACAGSPTTARSNVIYGSQTTMVEVAGVSCTHSYSVIGPMNTPSGIEVRSMTPAEINFVSAGSLTAAGLHIMAPSMLNGAAVPDSTTGNTAFDYDGQPRPADTTPPSTRADIGADEIP